MSSSADSSTTGALGAYELPEELKLLRQTVRDFMAREVRPAEDGENPDAYHLPPEKLDPLRRKAKAAGLWCLASPEEHGGAGLGWLAQAIVAEEASQCRMGAYAPACGAFGYDPPSVIFSAGTAGQIAKYAIPAVKTGEPTFVAISEASGGSDPARSIRTTARREGDHYVLNGGKFWISHVLDSAWGIVFARTGEGRNGISAFIVERETQGFQAVEIPVIRSWSPTEVFLSDCRVPAENLLGPEGQGFQAAQYWLNRNRIPYAAGTIGIAVAAMHIAIDWAKQRRTFDGTLAQKQAIQFMLADSEIELRAARLLVWQAAWKADLDQPFSLDASIAKVFATEAAFRVVDRCVQILGGMGVAKELPLERWFRELRIKRIGEGPSEVHRHVVARDLFGAAMRPAAS
jgi:acyl-CoA dehydrogenase